MSNHNIDYFTKRIQQEVMKLVDLPSDAFFKKLVLITSHTSKESGRKLINLHYNPDKLEELLKNPGNISEKTISNLSKIRGVIVDVHTMKIILRSFPRTNVIHVNQVPSDKLLPIKVYNDYCVPQNGVYKRCYGGALLRSFYHHDKAFLSTHKKIDASESHFADSEKFVDIWLKNQNVFPTVQSLYDSCPTDIIHLFIINDRKLLVDSREKQDIDRVVYLKSYSMSNPDEVYNFLPVIEQKNSTATKPIYFCEVYSIDQVNKVLSGKVYSIEDNEDVIARNNYLRLLSGGEKIIYENSFGIFTLVPESCDFRQTIMDGKININKLFVDCIANHDKNKGFMDVAFDYNSLMEITDKMKNAEEFDLEIYDLIKNNWQLRLLTNLIFIVPINRIDECFNAYNSFNESIISTIDFMFNIKDDMKEAIVASNLEAYQGLGTGVKFRSYLVKTMLEPTKFVSGPFDYWPEGAISIFQELYKKHEEEDNESLKEQYSEKMGIVSIICNATEDNLYAFTTYEKKVFKEKEAHSKRQAKI